LYLFIGMTGLPPGEFSLISPGTKIPGQVRRPARYTTHGKELADGYDNVMAFVERLHAESMEIFGQLTDEDLQKKCKTPDDAPITTWKWLRLMVEHEIHHRGQVYIYLSLLGVATPPLYGLTSEEVRSRVAVD
jgi:uncharacterized damage-inducible protein DinB